MKAAIMRGFGSQSKFVIENVNRPACGKRSVIVEIYNASINPLDWKLHTALSYVPANLAAPLILGRDFSGVIVEKGPEVHDLNIGDEVYGMSLNFLKGTYAEFAEVSPKHLARKPNNLSLPEAAAIPLVGLTAFRALKSGKVEAGTKVVIVGASGGVGTMAVQIAKAWGATVIGVCSAKNKALVESLGADQVINYTQENYVDWVSDVDVVFDTTGKESLSKCQSILKDNGRFVTIDPGATTAVNLVESLFGLKKQKVKIVSTGVTREGLDALTQMIENGQLKPVIDSEYTFEQINESLEKSKTKRACGKIILTMKEKAVPETPVVSPATEVKESAIPA